MQPITVELLRRRLTRMFAKSALSSQSFGPDCELVWGVETHRRGSAYHWDGMNRGMSRRDSRFIFQYTLDGHGTYAEGDRSWPVRPGHGFMAVLPSPHRYYLPRTADYWTFFWMIVQHPFATQRLRALRKKEAGVQEWKLDSPSLQAALNLFETACEGGWRDRWGFEGQMIAWVFEIERELDRRRYPHHERQQWLEEIRRLVHDRLPRPLGIPELAAGRQMERTTFSRKFKAATGLSPAAFITHVRLEEAVKLLRTRSKLEEIAARTGYADANHFCKVFRRHFRSSPGAYRQLILKR